LIVAVTIGVVVGLQFGTVSGAFAGKPKPFKITKATPNPVTLTIPSTPGSASGNITIKWKGTAAFPITANLTPAPGCSSGGFTCSPGSTTFASGKKKLVWVDGNNCSISAGSGTHTGTWDLSLTDANNRTTPSIDYVVTCTWS
jgi:hypothetical protein